ncbi:MAG: 50S ribosomal protein L9 [Elusimicrobia bacterium CG03_land_8_20_14_0_80_50_18]|nr:MAG: 50S ribosomal protein L9 [Elusimicrobia bacterium CG03_land_8_20_14_0_80_50_18]
MMKVILTKNVENLGDIGEIKTVSDGYARNYLLPGRFALKATKHSEQQVEKMKARYIAEKGKLLQKAKGTAEAIGKIELNIAKNVHEEKKLFGSLGVSEITDALAAKKIQVDRKAVIIKEPIKEIGIYDVEIRLHPEVSASVKVWVTAAE